MVYASFRRVKRALWGTLKKLFNVRDVLCEAIGRKRLKEDAAITLALDSWIEEHEYTTVVERTDQSAKALFERDDSVRNLVVKKRLAPESFNGFHAGFDDGVGGNGKGEAVNDHTR